MQIQQQLDKVMKRIMQLSLKLAHRDDEVTNGISLPSCIENHHVEHASNSIQPWLPPLAICLILVRQHTKLYQYNAKSPEQIS